MLNRHHLIPVVALGALVAGPVSASDDNATASDGLGSRVLAIIETVLDYHVSPPTRQEMVLAAARTLYKAAKNDPPPDLSRRVSALATNQQVAEYVQSLKVELEQLPDFDDRFVSALLSAVPGEAQWFDGEEARVQAQLAANRYVGIGIALAKKDDWPRIFKLFYHGPGRAAGVLQDDLILEIDGQSTQGKDLAQVVNELRGAEGSEVVLLLKNDDQPPREVRVTRGVTFIPSVEGVRERSDGQWEYTDQSAPDIAVLRVKQIGPSTLHELKKAEAELRRAEIAGIVLDLRYGGGTLHDVVMLADALIESGTIGYVKTRDALTKHTAQSGRLFTGLPLAVLIHEHTRGDCVFLTAALQDTGRAVVVGQPSLLDAYLRSQVEFPGGDKLVLATGYLLRGDGTALLREQSHQYATAHIVEAADFAATADEPSPKPGYVIPDYIVQPPSRSERRADSQDGVPDPMLTKAIEVLRNSATQARADARNARIAR